MTRRELGERLLRLVYGEQPTDDADITDNLMSKWIADGCAVAAKTNYKDALVLDGIGYVNNSFYTTFKGITFVKDEKFTYKGTLPHIPLGIGRNEGIGSMRFKNANGKQSFDAIPLTENEWTYYESMPPIPNKIVYKPESEFIYAKSVLDLTAFTANVTMVSAGDDNDLDSTLNVPQDYIPIITEYVSKILMQQRSVPKDLFNDGQDN